MSSRGTTSGGTFTTYCAGLSEVRKSQYRGNSESSPAARSTRWTGSLLLILDVGPERTELHDRDGHGHDEEDDGHRAGETVAAELERGAVDELHDRDRRVVRSAAVRHHVHALEDLEREDRVDDEEVQRRRLEQRHGDVPPLRERPGALDLGGFVELSRERAHRGRVEDDAAAGDREDGAQNDRGQRLVGAADPEQRLDAEDAEDGVREPIWVGVEDPAPYHRDEDRGVHEGQIEERAVEGLTSRAERMDETGNDEGERQLRGDDHRRIEDGVAERLPEDRVLRERDEILQADELATDDPRALERKHERLDDRQEREDDEQREGRQDEEIRPAVTPQRGAHAICSLRPAASARSAPPRRVPASRSSCPRGPRRAPVAGTSGRSRTRCSRSAARR